MTDYEEYKKIFLDMASQQIDNNELECLSKILDKLCDTYTINKYKIDLSTSIDGLPIEAQNYLMSRKIEGCTQATIDNKTVMLKCFFRMVPKPVTEITTNDVPFTRSNTFSSTTIVWSLLRRALACALLPFSILWRIIISVIR